MVTITKIDSNEKQIMGTYQNNYESKIILKKIIESICSNEFGISSDYIFTDWSRGNIDQSVDDSLKEFTFLAPKI